MQVAITDTMRRTWQEQIDGLSDGNLLVKRDVLAKMVADGKIPVGNEDGINEMLALAAAACRARKLY